MRRTFQDFYARKKPWFRVALLFLGLTFVFWLFLGREGPVFYQTMAPFSGPPLLVALLAFIPSFLMMTLMSMGKLKSQTIVLLSLFSALVLALFVWRMPLQLAGQSILFGALVAVFPILWALLHAMWLFKLLVDSGYFDVFRRSLQEVSGDRRIQTILVGFGLTAALESTAAFGAPIVISTSIMAGLGFPPVLAASIALIANSSPSSWGTQALPIYMLSSVTGLEADRLGRILAWQTPWITALLPFGLVLMVAGRKGLRGVWSLALTAGLGYAVTALLTSRFVSISVTGLASGMGSMLAILLWVKLVKPKEAWLFPGEEKKSGPGDPPSRGEVLRAWSPFLVLILVVGLFNGTGLASLLGDTGKLAFPWPRLDGHVFAVDPLTDRYVEYPARFSQNILTSGGSLVLLAGWLAAPFIRMKPGQVLRSYWASFKDMLPAGATIATILGLAYLMNYSGMAASIGLAAAQVHALFLAPLFALLGLLGCVLAGSVSGGNALFGGAALFAAGRVGHDPYFITGTLCAGGTLGKPITPQNIVLAEAAIGRQEEGEAPKLISRVFLWVAAYTLVLVVLVFVQGLLWRPA